MILLWGVGTDPPLAAVRTALAARGRTAVLVDQRAVLDTGVDVLCDDPPVGWLQCGGLRLDLGRVTAAYVRPYDPLSVPDVIAAGPDSPQARHAISVGAALAAFCEATPARVVNRISANASNASKPYQAAVSRAAGFSVPETLLTTDPDAARAFCERHREVIYKSMSAVRSIVSRVTRDKLARLAAVVTCPTQFQRYVPGVDVRVHVVDGDAFACEVRSTADDYRYAGPQGAPLHRRPTEIPVEIADRCRTLAQRLALVFAGIDLRRTPEGEWFCFEVNPAPAFTSFDDDGRIGRRLADLLSAAPAVAARSQA